MKILNYIDYNRGSKMEKMGMCIYLDDSKVEEYKKLHKNCPDKIRKLLKDVNIHNFSIFLKEPENILFSYWEYTGNNFEKDMKIMADNEDNKEWWKLCGSCQKPLPTRKKGEWWASMKNVFYN